MELALQILGVIGLFTLRLGIPLIITSLVVFGLRRLDQRWEVEAQERRNAIDLAMSAANLPQIPTVQQPCWEVRSCPDRAKESCPAYKRPAVACWIARFQAEGKLPSLCPGCTIFTTARRPQPMALEALEPAD